MISRLKFGRDPKISSLVRVGRLPVLPTLGNPLQFEDTSTVEAKPILVRTCSKWIYGLPGISEALRLIVWVESDRSIVADSPKLSLRASDCSSAKIGRGVLCSDICKKATVAASDIIASDSKIVLSEIFAGFSALVIIPLQMKRT